MSARDRILQRLHKAAPPGDAELSTGRPRPLPAQSIDNDPAQILGVFIAQAQYSGASVRKISGADELREAIARLSIAELSIAELSIAQLSIAQLSETNSLEIHDQLGSLASVPASTSEAGDTCTVVRADAAIAETGTVCIHSRQAPSGSLFLCDHLVVLLHETDILRHQEDYWLRRPVDDVASAIHLITGPSRTADVEQTIQVGAHGPKLVTILLIGD